VPKKANAAHGSNDSDNSGIRRYESFSKVLGVKRLWRDGHQTEVDCDGTG
jgi:hypothetical protein